MHADRPPNSRIYSRPAYGDLFAVNAKIFRGGARTRAN